MKLLAASAVSLLLVTGPTLAAGDPAAGKALAGTCSACHGVAGVSSNPEWPSLAGQHARYLAKQLRDFKAGKTRSNPIMAGMVAPLDDQKMEDLAAFFESQARPTGSADPALVKLGEKIYRGGNAETGVAACMACHGPNGIGDPRAGFPSLSGQHAKYVSNQLHAFARGDRSNDANGMMRDIAAKMSDEEIEAVASYVQGLY